MNKTAKKLVMGIEWRALAAQCWVSAARYLPRSNFRRGIMSSARAHPRLLYLTTDKQRLAALDPRAAPEHARRKAAAVLFRQPRGKESSLKHITSNTPSER